jgi:hypothetical protein
MNVNAGTLLLGGKKKSKKTGMKKHNENNNTSFNEVINVAEELRTKLAGGSKLGDWDAKVGFTGLDLPVMDTVLDSLRLASRLTPFESNQRLLAINETLLGSTRELFPVESEFIDLRNRFNNVKLTADTADIDREDLLEVTRTLLRSMLVKKAPTIKVYDYGRHVSQSINSFVRSIQQSCPPVNEPNKTESFVDPDGNKSCRVPIEKRRPMKGFKNPESCPEFAGSRRTQYHVTNDLTGVCREPVRTGAHQCPDPIYKNPKTGEIIYADPMATIHETLPGGVGICKRPFSMPTVITTTERALLSPNLVSSVSVKSTPNVRARLPQSRESMRASPAKRRSSGKRRSPKRKSSPKRRSSPRRGSKNRM